MLCDYTSRTEIDKPNMLVMCYDTAPSECTLPTLQVWNRLDDFLVRELAGNVGLCGRGGWSGSGWLAG